MLDFGEVNRLLDYMMGRFLHEGNLIQGGPDEVSYLFLDIFLGILREYPVKIALPTYYTGNYLINKAFLLS